MFAKEILLSLSSRLSPVLIALLVVFFVVETLYAAYRALLYFNHYMQNKHKNDHK
ncbi:MAG: hypothetical protein ACRC8T_03730 [Acidaminococcaceae bacterium]